YWTRTVTIPLLVLTALKPKAVNPRKVMIDELFLKPPDEEDYKLANPTDHWVGDVMLGLDRIAKYCEPLIPRALTRKAIDKAMGFVHERLNGENGLGGIFPAMANSLMAFKALGYSADHPDVVTARKALDRLLVVEGDSAYCQPCVSPIWDTGLAAHALMEAKPIGESPALRLACDWLTDRQVLDVAGDWISKRPEIRPGGWAFQYRNDHYPDVDDTAVVVMALHRTRDRAYDEAIRSGTEWVLGMQSNNGGWAAFDVDNEYTILEHMPFADHGALLDPPTADVTARCVGMLAQLGWREDHPQMSRALAFLKSEQEKDGSWYGRWGTNYVYGTWSVLAALNGAGEDMQAPYIRRAVDWIKSRQMDDGGWGEDCASYWDQRKLEVKAATPSQTAWALLALMAAGEVDSEAVAGGVKYLTDYFTEKGGWRDEYYNAVGFPRVFFLRYHGYASYFPLWALARYRNLRGRNNSRTDLGL
ncbi:MAG: squalene--hopene cyclase, partial [Rhodospirillales bacterium]|nr:squalene--hopene cyclase [Rhodospirillales bacterium]